MVVPNGVAGIRRCACADGLLVQRSTTPRCMTECVGYFSPVAGVSERVQADAEAARTAGDEATANAARARSRDSAIPTEEQLAQDPPVQDPHRARTRPPGTTCSTKCSSTDRRLARVPIGSPTLPTSAALADAIPVPDSRRTVADPVLRRADGCHGSRQPSGRITRAPASSSRGISAFTPEVIIAVVAAVHSIVCIRRLIMILTLLIGYPIAYTIAFQRRARQEHPAASCDPAVLHGLPDPDAVVEVDPRGQRFRARYAQGPRPGRSQRSRAGNAAGRDQWPYLQLPAVHGAAAVCRAREDRPAPD